jgi:hypothetical protein
MGVQTEPVGPGYFQQPGKRDLGRRCLFQLCNIAEQIDQSLIGFAENQMRQKIEGLSTLWGINIITWNRS